MTIHAGVLIQYLPMVSKRITGIVKSEAPAVDGALDPSLVSKEDRTRIGAIKA